MCTHRQSHAGELDQSVHDGTDQPNKQTNVRRRSERARADGASLCLSVPKEEKRNRFPAFTMRGSASAGLLVPGGDINVAVGGPGGLVSGPGGVRAAPYRPPPPGHSSTPLRTVKTPHASPPARVTQPSFQSSAPTSLDVEFGARSEHPAPSTAPRSAGSGAPRPASASVVGGGRNGQWAWPSDWPDAENNVCV